ncbi:hypothetical protein KKF29_03435 [Patescibacteria group bacterium]|nr:hypothetical protein [Patescibacteria group bacterium]
MEKKSDGKEKIIFLHHSTGENIWNGGLAEELSEYSIEEQEFPKDSPYGWENYPYDYWNIWVNNAGESEYMDEPTLEMLTQNYDVIMFKHCFPVGYIEEDTGNADIASSEKTLENYKLQYNALKEKMLEFPNSTFIVWTGATLVESETDPSYAERMQEFVNWVKTEWDEEGDNIYIWDFYDLETEGNLYLKDSYSQGDSHPNESFSLMVAPYLANRIRGIIEGDGDNNNLTGK